MALWQDRSGRFSPLKATTLAVLALPAAWLALRYALGDLGPRPLNEVIHETGKWALHWLLLSLAVTPLRRAWRWPRLIILRRMIGVAAFIYAAGHLALYAGDQRFDLVKIGSEILLRYYLTIGFVALLGLTALAVTSTDGMLRRIGGKAWQRLHKLVHPIMLLALIHHFMQAKADVSEPTLMAGLYAWLAVFRLVQAARGGKVELSSLALAGLAVVVGLACLAGEALGLMLTFGAPLSLLIGAEFSFDTGIRPGWYVLAAGLAIAAVAAIRRRPSAADRARPPVAGLGRSDPAAP